MRSLDETWKLCKSMWRWVAEHYTEYFDVCDAKCAWLEQHGFAEDSIWANCFFCDYNHEDQDNERDFCCVACPGSLVDLSFSCYNLDYNFEQEPKEFYNKIRRMDYARKRDMK